MSTVLVTGGAGFIGSNFVRFLAQTEDTQQLKSRPAFELKPSKIVVLDLLTYAGNLENINDLIKAGKVTFIKGDIKDKPLVSKVFASEKPDYVFHFAAESHVDRSILSADDFVLTNVVGTQNLLDAALEHRVKRFVHISTDEVYGSLGKEGEFKETTPLDPTSPYAASKAASDLLALAMFKTHGLNLVITRCTNNYGPYQFPEKFIPLFVTNALEGKELPLYGDGRNVRSWLYVLDHCEALCAAALRGRSGEVYNIGPGKEGEYENIEVAKMILDILGKPYSLITPVKDRLAHDRRYAVDIRKISEELGWSPRVSFKEGLQSTVNWYVENKEWWEKVKNKEYLEYYEKNYANR
ncbi:MAG: dTDP-glucose 4,6-dehydratase [Candidatus Dadabacteria bacterium]|nr:MAG: dTDP-glucose 4,6-dehydratase [Candidatus Dadabacteria bacterium]